MRKATFTLFAIMGILSLILMSKTALAAEEKGGANQSMIERGQYLVTIGGCNDCHTPKKMTPMGPLPDETRILSGHPAGEKLPEVPPNIFGPNKWGAITNFHLTAWVGPWGTSYTSNLTPDRETGTGTWNEELFIRILRTGKFMGAGRNILPPMPWYDYARLTDDDLKAIFAYLKSLTPVKNQVPVAILAPPPPQRQ
jgi:mono/diheme cytochrome c family protein